MAARFEFSGPGRIMFGVGILLEAGAAASELLRGLAQWPGGREAGAPRRARALLVSGGDAARLGPLLESLEAAGIEPISFTLGREPRFEDARAALDLAKSSGCAMTLGFGGGSAIDLAKAVAALLANTGDPLDYAEVIGGGKALSAPSFPCIAIPTTAGTGSEATRNAVLASPEHGVKVSLRSPTMLPSLALVDPEQTYDLPPRVTADTGMDALTQLFEPFTGAAAGTNPLVDGICREGIARAVAALPRAYSDGRNETARADMAFASLSGGLALANARLGAVHGIAGPLGGAFPIPHGAACAALAAPVVAVNVAALRAREPEHPALSRYAELGAALNGGCPVEPAETARLLADFSARLGIRKLREFGITRANFQSLAEKASASSSIRGNAIVLRSDEIMEILEMAL